MSIDANLSTATKHGRIGDAALGQDESEEEVIFLSSSGPESQAVGRLL